MSFLFLLGNLLAALQIPLIWAPSKVVRPAMSITCRHPLVQEVT